MADHRALPSEVVARGKALCDGNETRFRLFYALHDLEGEFGLGTVLELTGFRQAVIERLLDVLVASSALVEDRRTTEASLAPLRTWRRDPDNALWQLIASVTNPDFDPTAEPPS